MSPIGRKLFCLWNSNLPVLSDTPRNIKTNLQNEFNIRMPQRNAVFLGRLSTNKLLSFISSFNQLLIEEPRAAGD
jgi:hypothetical protein